MTSSTTTGPERFAPSKQERTIEEQLAGISKEEKECFDNLRKKWNAKFPDNSKTLNDEMLLRFAYCSPGDQKFNDQATWKVMNNYPTHFLTLKAVDIEVYAAEYLY